jgi:hypothetical protein
MMVKLKVNEIRSIIKMGDLNIRSRVERVAREVCSETFFYNGQGKLKDSYKNLMKTPNNIEVVFG